MTENQTEATGAVHAEAPQTTQTPAPELKQLAVKAIRRADGFPTVQDIAEGVIALGFNVPAGKGSAYVANKLVSLIEAGEIDEELRQAAQGRPTVKRKKIHDAKGRIKAEDKIGRKGHRELRLGLILRNGKGFRVCGRTTKDLNEAQKEAVYKMRQKGASWGEITNAHKLEYNHGMTARNIFLVVQRTKAK